MASVIIKEGKAEVAGVEETHHITATVVVDGKEYEVSASKLLGWTDVGGYQTDQIYEVELVDVPPELEEKEDWEELKEEIENLLADIEPEA